MVDSLVSALVTADLDELTRAREAGFDFSQGIERQDGVLTTCAHLALLSGSREALAFALANGVSPSARDSRGLGLVAAAALEAPVAAITHAVACGADIEMRDTNDWTAFLHACAGGDVIRMDLLVRAGADPGVRGSRDETAALLAARSGRTEAVDFLLERGVDFHLTDHLGRTPLHESVMADRTDLITLIAYAGVPVDARTRPDDDTALHLAARYARSNAARALVAFGAHLEVRNARGRTPACEAAAQSDWRIVFCLSKLGANFGYGARTTEGRTPAHFAAESGSPLVIRALAKADSVRESVRSDFNRVDARVDFRDKDREGIAPAALALHRELAVLEALREVGADFSVRTPEGTRLFEPLLASPDAERVAFGRAEKERFEERIANTRPQNDFMSLFS